MTSEVQYTCSADRTESWPQEIAAHIILSGDRSIPVTNERGTVNFTPSSMEHFIPALCKGFRWNALSSRPIRSPYPYKQSQTSDANLHTETILMRAVRARHSTKRPSKTCQASLSTMRPSAANARSPVAHALDPSTS